MEKYKICPFCGEHNPPTMVECIKCETDLSNIKMLSEDKKTNNNIKTNIVRICDCGFHNPVNFRKCSSCGEDISDITPCPENEKSEEKLKFVFTSIDGKYTYELKDVNTVIGRESTMQEYLSSKPYVSRKQAELIIENDALYIVNLSKTNFTYVNDTKISDGKFRIYNGDEIGLGGKAVCGMRQNEAAYFLVKIEKCI